MSKNELSSALHDPTLSPTMSGRRFDESFCQPTMSVRHCRVSRTYSSSMVSHISPLLQVAMETSAGSETPPHSYHGFASA